MKRLASLIAVLAFSCVWCNAEEFPKPYSPPCTERENVFAFTEKPAVKNLGNDKYEITFAVKGNCDVTAGLVDAAGIVVRHLASGVLGANARVSATCLRRIYQPECRACGIIGGTLYCTQAGHASFW